MSDGSRLFSNDPPAPEVLGRAREALQAEHVAGEVRELVTIARQLTGTSLAAVSVPEGGVYHYPVFVGMEPLTLPFDETMCRLASGRPGMFEVPDTRRDPELADNPFVTGERLALHYYASWPLTDVDGEEIGRLCLFDEAPRTLEPTAARAVGALSRAVSRALGAHADRARPTDPMVDMMAVTAQISHDLQSPLWSLRMTLHMLVQDDVDTATRATLVGVAERSVSRMTDMIEGTLRLHDLSSGPVQRERFDVAAVVAQLLVDEALDLHRHGAQVDVGYLPAAVGDAAQVGAVFQNLLHNALKYARHDVPLRVSIQGDRHGDCIRFTVTDNGTGIPVEDRERVFSLSTRLTATAGHGIGLATVARIIAGHGGGYGITDGEGTGVQFWFELPAPPPTLEDPDGLD